MDITVIETQISVLDNMIKERDLELANFHGQRYAYQQMLDMELTELAEAKKDAEESTNRELSKCYMHDTDIHPFTKKQAGTNDIDEDAPVMCGHCLQAECACLG